MEFTWPGVHRPAMSRCGGVPVSNWRENRVFAYVTCRTCLHQRALDLREVRVPGSMPLSELHKRLICGKCGSRDIDMHGVCEAMAKADLSAICGLRERG